LFEIGASLKEARLRQGLDFPEIETGTKIRGKYLNALEEERFDVLPGETYIKGFLRTYAEFLGLDGQLYVDEFNSRYVAPDESEMQTIRVRRTAQARRHRRVQGGVLIAALVGIAVVTALVIVAWTSGSAPNQPVAGISSNGSTNQKKHKRTQPQSAKAHITLRAVRSYVSLLAVRKGGPTGKILLENVELAPGEAKRFTRRSLWINTGTPGNLRVVVNGKRVTYPGGKPQAFVVSARGIIAPA
jgi:cytoskeleton protein RodZ